MWWNDVYYILGVWINQSPCPDNKCPDIVNTNCYKRKTAFAVTALAFKHGVSISLILKKLQTH